MNIRTIRLKSKKEELANNMRMFKTIVYVYRGSTIADWS